MFNKKFRDESVEKLKLSKSEYDLSFKQLLNETERLQNSRKTLKALIDQGWNTINSFRNTPEEWEANIIEIRISSDRYSELLAKVEKEIKDIDIKSAGSVAVGAAAGAGVAAFGGSALTSLAMAVGTAGTGASIGGLSGIAATNAALAWLGGGTLAAGGAGIAGGEAVLGLMGPVGWAIGGATLVGTGVVANHKNKDSAEKALKQAESITAAKLVNDGSKTEVFELESLTTTTISKLMAMNARIEAYSRDYINLTEDEQMRLGAFVNNVLSGAKLLNKVIGKKAEKSSDNNLKLDIN